MVSRRLLKPTSSWWYSVAPPCTRKRRSLSASASSFVVFERGHVTAGDVLRFGLWMTLVAYVTILAIAVPYWALLGYSIAIR